MIRWGPSSPCWKRAVISPTAAEPSLEALRTLRRIRSKVEALESEAPGADPAHYAEITTELTPLLGELRGSNVVQVDMSRDVAGVLSRAEADTIARAALVMQAFARPANALDAFAKAFAGRYEGREVTLMEALDDEVGIGFPHAQGIPAVAAPLLAGMPILGTKPFPMPMNERARFLARKLEATWKRGSGTLLLTSADVALIGEQASAPPAATAIVSLLGAAHAGGPRRIWIRSLLGDAGGKILGRFASWNDEMADLLRSWLDEEEAQQPEAIFAEVVHQPIAPRLGNILLRPLLRRHEIPFCGRSTAPDENVIPLTDLRVSVVGGRVVLRSARWRREVLPRLSNAHYTGAPGNLAVYRFLTALQGQGSVGFGQWDWGPFADAATLPRVEVDEIILSPRTWTLPKASLQRLTARTPAARFRAAQQLRDAHEWPRFLGLMDGDNVLPIDLDNSLSVDAFAGLLKARESARVAELLIEDEDLTMSGPRGRYANELVVPLLRVAQDRAAATVSTPRAAPVTAPSGAAPSRRQFPPGSEWLYVKVYCATSHQDTLLATVIAEQVAAHRSQGGTGWFFIRYADPDPHLRVRFRGDPSRLLGTVLPALSSALSPELASGRVSRLEVATYDREIERYGGDAQIELCERIFAADSDTVLALTSLLVNQSQGAETSRWQWALYGMDRLLADFGLGLDARRALVVGERSKFAAEMATPPAGEHALGDRYRRDRGAIEAILRSGEPRVTAIFDARSAALEPIVEMLRRAPSNGRPLLPPLLHMWNNRILRTQARLHELVLHDFLARAYTSSLARQRDKP